MAEKAHPDIVLEEIPDEYRSMVETRVIEIGKEGVVFVTNRGVSGHSLEVAAKAYKAIKTKVGMYSVSKQLLD